MGAESSQNTVVYCSYMYLADSVMNNDYITKGVFLWFTYRPRSSKPMYFYSFEKKAFEYQDMNKLH